MPAIARVPPRSSAARATGTSVPTGAKRMAASRGSGGAAVASPTEATPRSSASWRAAAERVSTCTVAPLGQCHLRRQMRRGTEAVDAQPTAGGQRRPPQRPVPDDPGAQQRGALLVGERRRDRVGVVLGDDGILGVPAVVAEDYA